MSEQDLVIDGQVKWFDPVKGFGFVVADSGGPDILLHANVLRNFGQSSIADGARVQLAVQETARGMQAVAVLSVAASEAQGAVGLSDLDDLDPDYVASRPMEPARVKWFDKGKGFGFANVFLLPEDVFIHMEVLRRSGLADLQPGEAVVLRVIEGHRGRMAVDVMSWDSAGRSGRPCRVESSPPVTGQPEFEKE
ncbi:cold-shock protein [Pseudoroseicyclus aestuarii]|uniref:Putative cold-shock DNA-binding protein n=1 Tax=Pseudoroseicyclus aestuarii TaxID=1795041 RepID=A0A318SMU9_9RHOB|nr:cold shock domain-containing protein [Pseudoroseicyclus aestuarii]PYE81390.1 putative cold-shock DNA-binding protein [Pseudoroseicyclus aestuarii]